MSESIPRAVWEGEFTLLGVRLRCYQLDNGQRIINGDDFGLFLAALEDPNGEAIDQAEVEKFALWKAGAPGGPRDRSN